MVQTKQFNICDFVERKGESKISFRLLGHIPVSPSRPAIDVIGTSTHAFQVGAEGMQPL